MGTGMGPQALGSGQWASERVAAHWLLRAQSRHWPANPGIGQGMGPGIGPRPMGVLACGSALLATREEPPLARAHGQGPIPEPK